MKITIIQVGKTRQSWFLQAEKEYVKRVNHYAKVKFVTIKEGSAVAKSIAGRMVCKKKEAAGISKCLQCEGLAGHSGSAAENFIITLDEKGKSLGSIQFSEFIKKKRDFERVGLIFIIGGIYGLSEDILKIAHLRLSFSSFTFTHEMIRTVLLEQLYRAFTIIAGKNYHY